MSTIVKCDHEGCTNQREIKRTQTSSEAIAKEPWRWVEVIAGSVNYAFCSDDCVLAWSTAKVKARKKEERDHARWRARREAQWAKEQAKAEAAEKGATTKKGKKA